jgi:hypothetical protein
VNLFDDYNGTGEFFPRPDIVGDPFAGTRSPDNFLNLSAFKVPCTLDPSGDGSAASCIPGTQHFGNLGRNSLVGPGYANLDLSLFKTTPLGEQVKLQIRAEVFNIFNHPNFSSPLLPGFSVDASFNGIDPVTGRGSIPADNGDAGCWDRQPVSWRRRIKEYPACGEIDVLAWERRHPAC